MRTVEIQERERAAIENVTPRNVTMHFIVRPDARMYNNPTNDEVAAIAYLSAMMGQEPPSHRDIVVYPIGEAEHRISYLSCHLNPIIYPILFPNGEPGWHINIPQVEHLQTRTRNKVTNSLAFIIPIFLMIF